MKRPQDYPQLNFRLPEDMKIWVQKTAARYSIAPSHFIRTLVFHAMRVRDDSAMRKMIGSYTGNPSWTRIKREIETPEEKAARDKSKAVLRAQRPKREAQEKQEQERSEAGFYKRK